MIISDFPIKGQDTFNYSGTLLSKSLIERTITSVALSLSSIATHAFAECRSLSIVNLPLCEYIDNHAFYNCTDLSSIYIPKCTYVGTNAFNQCYSLTNINLLQCTEIGSYAFGSCYSLTEINIPNCLNIYNSAFNDCYRLISLYLGNTIPILESSKAFISTPIGGYSSRAGQYGSIYVPASKLTDYQNDSVWGYFSNRLVGI